MLGLVLACLYAAYLYAFQKAPQELAYLQSTHFLYCWYWVWAIVAAVFVVGIVLVALFGGGAVGAANGGFLGGLLGLGAGGALSVLVLFGFFINNALFIGGAYLLNTALTHSATAYTWEVGRVVIGSILLFLGLMTRSTSSSSSSSSD